MTIQCSDLDNLLFEGDADALAAAHAHTRTCQACRETLDSWTDLSATATTMQTTWTSDLLWPRIERRLRQERRRGRSAFLQVAAALLVVAGIALIAVRVQRRSEFDEHILRAAAVEEVDRAERAHIAAIDQLEQVTDAKLENASSPLMVSYKEKLMLLDDAIAECQTNINRNRHNAQLRKQLLAMYSEKQRTLHDVLREDTHANQ
jgi:preprotein translocase subunit SecA